MLCDVYLIMMVAGKVWVMVLLFNLKEETGIEVDSITYYKSQPWSLSGSLLFGFWAKVKDSSAITLDENELSLARWITREELKNHLPSPIALTGDMMMKYVKGEHNQ